MASNRLRQAIQDMAQSSQRLATLAQEVSQVRTGVSLVNSNLTVIRRAAEEAARQSFGGDTNAVAQVKREVAEMNQRHFTLTQEMAQMNARLATMDTNVTKLSAHTATRGRQLFYTFLLLAVMIPLLIFFRK